MFSATVATASVQVVHRTVDLPAALSGLCVVVGLANPQWPHVGLGYRRGHLGGAIDVGSVRSANALSAEFRLFYTDSGWSPYLSAGVSASQLTVLNSGFAATDQTPQDVFFSEFVDAGYEFLWPHMVVNLGLGIPFVPARSTAPPTVLIGSGLLPALQAEVGYEF